MKRPWLLPLTPLWRLATYLKNHAYDRHLTSRRLQKPVISIGSLSAGGAGKTPVVIALAQLLARHNISADVLSRGYGRGSGAIEQVNPQGDPTRFGDEPLEIAQTSLIAQERAHSTAQESELAAAQKTDVIPSEARSAQSRNPRIPPPRHTANDSTKNVILSEGAPAPQSKDLHIPLPPHTASDSTKNVILSEARSAQSKDLQYLEPRQAPPPLSATIPIFVGANRHAAGQLAEATLPHTALHLLDDGFQHRRLVRSLDLVLLTVEDTKDHLLPAGNLREPLTSLARAHAILLREEEAATLIPIATRYAPETPTWLIQRNLHLPTTNLQRPIAFCGVARPTNFFTQLRIANITLAGEIPFPDHYPYTSEDITALIRAAQRTQADAFVTTAKDAVKLPPEFRARLQAVAPLHIARLEVHFLDESQVIAAIASLLK